MNVRRATPAPAKKHKSPFPLVACPERCISPALRPLPMPTPYPAHLVSSAPGSFLLYHSHPNPRVCSFFPLLRAAAAAAFDSSVRCLFQHLSPPMSEPCENRRPRDYALRVARPS